MLATKLNAEYSHAISITSKKDIAPRNYLNKTRQNLSQVENPERELNNLIRKIKTNAITLFSETKSIN